MQKSPSYCSTITGHHNFFLFITLLSYLWLVVTRCQSTSTASCDGSASVATQQPPRQPFQHRSTTRSVAHHPLILITSENSTTNTLLHFPPDLSSHHSCMGKGWSQGGDLVSFPPPPPPPPPLLAPTTSQEDSDFHISDQGKEKAMFLLF